MVTDPSPDLTGPEKVCPAVAIGAGSIDLLHRGIYFICFFWYFLRNEPRNEVRNEMIQLARSHFSG